MRRLKSKLCLIKQYGDEVECARYGEDCPKKINRGKFGSDCFKIERRA